ncbi:MAG TPA: class I SAM-dependent methyltransferase [Pseudonocardiaceae bacterium]
MNTTENAFHYATGRAIEAAGAVSKPKYHRYQYDLISKHCGRSVLEVGAGLGEFAGLFEGRDRVVVTDVDKGAVAFLEEKFADRPSFEVERLDLDHIDEADIAAVESVLAINVLEHFDDDVALLRGLARLVRPGGNIVLWVPAFPALYGEFDRKVGHFRRYTPRTLRDVALLAGLRPASIRAVNLIGGLAWWAAVRRGGNGSPDGRLVGIYDRFFVPVSRVLDRVAPVPFGQSVLAVLQVLPDGPRTS